LSRRGRSNVTQVARSGGVVVGRNNSGTITTGAQGKAAPASGDWVGIVGVIVAVLGVIVAVLAWWLPRAPGP
jgi:hypothetical protein